MGIPFSVGEVLEIAQQIERNGARFYRRAAEQAPSARVGETLLELAAMEDRHEQVFAAMAADLSDVERRPPAYDPYDESVQYMRAAAGGHVFDLRTDPVEWLEGSRTMQQVLGRAMELEKDSIVYYLGVRGVMPDDVGRARVDGVIREEMGHLTLLNTMVSMADEEAGA